MWRSPLIHVVFACLRVIAVPVRLLRPHAPPPRLFALLGLLLVLTFGASQPVLAATTYTVCASGCDHTAIQEAVDAATDGDTITVTDAVHTEADIQVDKELTIQGEGAANTTVQAAATAAAATNRVFEVTGSPVTIQDMTIQYGNKTLPTNGTNVGGGAILHSGSLTLNRVVIRDNRALQGGGVTTDGGDLTVNSSTLHDNTATNVTSGSPLSPQGGGIFIINFGSATIDNSTLADNHAAYGGGIAEAGASAMDISNSTVYRNSGLPEQGCCSSFGGGMDLQDVSPNVQNSIFAANTPTNVNVSGFGLGVNSLGYNIEDKNDAFFDATDLRGTDPLLFPTLADNGGPTPTHALLPASPAINRIPVGTNGCAAGLEDQRGTDRPQGSGCDVGAFEFIPLSLAGTNVDSFTDSNGDSQANPGETVRYTVTITNTSDVEALGATFDSLIDDNTSLVSNSLSTTPLARNDSYTALGNVPITIGAASGVLANDVDLDDGGTLTVSGGSTSIEGGNVTLNADGSFTYNPPPGFEGADIFTYTVTDDEGQTNTGSVTVTVDNVIWFIQDNAPAGGDGRINSPFGSIFTFTSTAADDPGDIIFIYSGGGPSDTDFDYLGSLILQDEQKLIGQGVDLQTATGITPPSGSQTLPGAAANPIVRGSGDTVTVAENNTISGLTLGSTSTLNGLARIKGFSFGTLTVSQVALTGTGRTLNLGSGTLAATFTSIESTNAINAGHRGLLLFQVGGNLTVTGGTSISNQEGVGIEILSSSATLDFGNTTVNNSSSTGVRLEGNTGPITFASLNITVSNASGLVGRNNSGTIAVTNGTGSISATGGPALNITNDSVTTPLNLNFSSLMSINSPTHGIRLDRISGSVTSGSLTVTNATIAPKSITNSTATISFGMETINGMQTRDTGAHSTTARMQGGQGVASSPTENVAEAAQGAVRVLASPMNPSNAGANSVAAQGPLLTLGTLNPRESITIVFDVTIDDPLPAGVEEISSQGTLSGSNFTNLLTDDPDAGGTADPTTRVVVAVPDLEITMDDGTLLAEWGTPITYTLTYSNTGNQGATGVVITDTVPDNTTFDPAGSTAGWTCTPDNDAGSTCTYPVTGLEGGASATRAVALAADTVIFTVIVDNPPVLGVTTVTNRATIGDDGTNGTDPTPGNNDTGDVITPISPPLAVQLAGFSAEVGEGHVLLRWETVSEQESAGFNVWRGTSAAAAETQLNDALIPSQGPASSEGFAYEWVDASVAAGATYFYWLEAVDVNGGTQRFGPVSAMMEAPTSVTVGAFNAGSAASGGWLLAALGLTMVGGLLVLRRRR